MSVGVMEDYKLRDLRASHTLGRSGRYRLLGLYFFCLFFSPLWKRLGGVG
jgi:hypothetical protein